MTAVQMMCARLGMVPGRGLAGVIRHHYPRWVLWGACALLVIANTVNIGADLGGMAKVTERKETTNADLRQSRNDVVTGMFFSNLIMYFILTTAATLHARRGDAGRAGSRGIQRVCCGRGGGVARVTG